MECDYHEDMKEEQEISQGNADAWAACLGLGWSVQRKMCEDPDDCLLYDFEFIFHVFYTEFLHVNV